MSRFAQSGRHKKEIQSLLVVVAVLSLRSLLNLVVNCRVVSAIYYWDSPKHVNYCPDPASGLLPLSWPGIHLNAHQGVQCLASRAEQYGGI